MNGSNNPFEIIMAVFCVILLLFVACELFKACGSTMYDQLTGSNDGFKWYMNH